MVGALRALERGPAGPREDPAWYAALGQVLGFGVLAGAALVSVLPGLRTGLTGGSPVLWARVVQAGLFGLLFWRHPVPALWIFLLPNVLLPLGRARWATLIAVFPAAALLALGAAAWWRGLVTGVWLNPFEIVALILAFALAFVRPAGSGKRKKKKKRRR